MKGRSTMLNEEAVTEYATIENYQEVEEIYTKVVQRAKDNGYVWGKWIERVFELNQRTASIIVQRMEKEGLCEQWCERYPERKMLV